MRLPRGAGLIGTTEPCKAVPRHGRTAAPPPRPIRAGMAETTGEGANQRASLHPALGTRPSRRRMHQVPRLLMGVETVGVIVPGPRITSLRRETVAGPRVAAVARGRQVVSEVPVEVPADVLTSPERRQLLRRVKRPQLNRRGAGSTGRPEPETRPCTNRKTRRTATAERAAVGAGGPAPAPLSPVDVAAVTPPPPAQEQARVGKGPLAPAAPMLGTKA